MLNLFNTRPGILCLNFCVLKSISLFSFVSRAISRVDNPIVLNIKTILLFRVLSFEIPLQFEKMITLEAPVRLLLFSSLDIAAITDGFTMSRYHSRKIVSCLSIIGTKTKLLILVIQYSLTFIAIMINFTTK
jgi:hypothetical protein